MRSKRSIILPKRRLADRHHTDHGGIETWHGGPTLEERSTWIVCNKPIDEKYMGSGYDGYTEK